MATSGASSDHRLLNLAMRQRKRKFSMLSSKREGQKVSTKWGLHPNLKEELQPEEWKELTEIMGKVTTIVGNRFSQILVRPKKERQERRELRRSSLVIRISVSF